MGIFIAEIPSGERILTPANVTFSFSLGSIAAPPEFFEIISLYIVIFDIALC